MMSSIPRPFRSPIASIAGALVGAFVALGALLPAAAVADEPQQHIIELQVNGGAPRVLLVWGEPGTATLLRVEDWNDLRLAPPAQVLQCGAAPCVRLEDLAGIGTEFDAGAQRLTATIPADHFVESRFGSARSSSPAPEVSPGFLLNYDVSAWQTDEDSSAAALLELNTFNRHGRFSTSVVGRQQYDGQGLVRLDTAWRKEWPGDRMALTVGDTIADFGGWGVPLRMAGIGWGTDFSLQPDFITSPLLAASGSAALPSVVDVYVNERRVASEQVPAGPFSIQDLTPMIGAGEVSVVVRDPLGRETVLTQSFYAPPRLLRAGLTSHTLALGTLRQDYGTRSFGYEDLLAGGSWRRGLNDDLTVGVGLAATGDHGSTAGTEVDFQAGNFATMRLQGAMSDSTAGAGVSYGVTAERRGRRFDAVVTYQQQDEKFRSPGEVEMDELLGGRYRQRVVASASTQLGRLGSLTVSGLHQTFHADDDDEEDDEPLRTVSAAYSFSRNPIGHLALSVSMSEGARDDWQVQMGWHRSLGNRRSTGITQQQSRDGESRVSASLRQSPPRGPGHGYAARIHDDGDFSAEWITHQESARWSIETARQSGATGVRGNINGSVMRLDDWHVSRRVEGGFAVVDFDGVAGLTVYADNQPVAVTDEKGRALLPDLRPYEANRISIDPKSVPLGVQIEEPRMAITPAALSGLSTRFPMRQSVQITGRLQLPSGAPVPAGAIVEPGTVDQPVGFDGLIYLEEQPDASQLQVVWSGGSCSFTLAKAAPGFNDVGTIPCQP